MRILFIGHTSGIHGSSIALFNIIKSLQNKYDIHVLLPETNGILNNKLKNSNVAIHSFNYTLNVAALSIPTIRQIKHIITTTILNRKAKKLFDKLLRSISPDLVHCNVGPISFVSDICIKYNIPLVWHIREYQDKDFGMRFIPSKHAFKNALSKRNNIAIAITKDIFNYWELNSNKDKVIYDGVFSKKDKPNVYPKSKYFLFVGRVIESKGTLEVIRCFMELSKIHPDYNLLIAGAFRPDVCKYANECQEFVLRHGLDKTIKFLGERTDVYELMSRSIALIVASKSEGFGFITVEGMLNRTLVIGKNAGGTKEQFDNGLEWTGSDIGLRYNTEEELVECMKSAIEINHEITIEKAYQVVWNHYSIENHVCQLDQIYTQLLKNEE